MQEHDNKGHDNVDVEVVSKARCSQGGQFEGNAASACVEKNVHTV